MSANALIDDAMALSPAERIRLMRALSDNPNLDVHERAFLAEYERTVDLRQAGLAAGFKNKPAVTALKMLHSDTEIAATETARCMAAEIKAGLTSLEVRSMIRDALYFDLLECFDILPDGELLPNVEAIRALPEHKRILLGVETTVDRGRVFYSIRFPDKLAFATMAARLTDKDKALPVDNNLWDAISQHADDEVERRILAVAEEPAQLSETTVAESQVLQQTA